MNHAYEYGPLCSIFIVLLLIKSETNIWGGSQSKYLYTFPHVITCFDSTSTVYSYFLLVNIRCATLINSNRASSCYDK